MNSSYLDRRKEGKVSTAGGCERATSMRREVSKMEDKFPQGYPIHGNHKIAELSSEHCVAF